ncbi:hypothetical protein [Flavobacterium quisquiliarum]|uniref:Lipoprotein n=1 Tax=Flavobacterium quisquiliarum TaxID=1834436 RepID=A0ABV8W587_9FLAO|nr:hypothetical protein [Flavobacterium quisquiliarum]MBW1656838.1 hypothetical protein [Flavobacterium quisquiliarum]NWK99497.1 hypothetical protein [Flavobacterium collinsii]
MKYLLIVLILILASSCQITETITINSDGSGDIEIVQQREENSYMQLAGEEYSKENVFQDTTYVFKDYIAKYKENFAKYKPEEQQLFQKYANVKAQIKRSSYEKEFRTAFALHFDKVSEIPDLFKTEDYTSDIQHNYALTAEEHYFRIGYEFDGKTFKRSVSIINTAELEKAKSQAENFEKKYGSSKLVQSYLLKYHFPKKIKSVSNSKAVINSDKKSLTLEFKLSDCLRNPEMTNLEVILE